MTREHIKQSEMLPLAFIRVPSGVLQLAIGISLIVSVLCSSMILLVYYSKLNFTSQKIERDLHDNAASGIQYVLGNRKELSFNKSERIDLFGDQTDSVEVLKKPWGIFELATAKSFRGGHHYLKSALITSMPDKIGRSTMYVPDNNAPVYLAGKTLIKGTVYASERKFSSAYVEGKDFEGDRFVYGDILRSESTMPKLDTLLIHEMRLLFERHEGAYNIVEQNRFPRGKLLFDSPVNYYFSNQSIDITDTIIGNAVIHSAFKIHVSANAVLTDIILLSPDIDIEKGFKGSLQCFASHSILVGDESELSYPSALVLMGFEKDSTISVGKEAEIDGVVVIAGYDQITSSPGVFKIEKGGAMHGMAYINGSADIQGKLYGHIATRQFQAATSRWTVYGNHILNGIIDGTRRSPQLPASLLWGNTTQLTVAKWIN